MRQKTLKGGVLPDVLIFKSYFKSVDHYTIISLDVL